MKTRILTCAFAIGAAFAATAVCAEASARQAPYSISEHRDAPRASKMPTRRHVHGVTRSRPGPLIPAAPAVNYWQQQQNQGS